MLDVEVLPKDASVNNPNKIFIERFTRNAFCIGHAGVLNLNDDSFWSFYVCAVDFSVGGGM